MARKVNQLSTLFHVVAGKFSGFMPGPFLLILQAISQVCWIMISCIKSYVCLVFVLALDSCFLSF